MLVIKLWKCGDRLLNSKLSAGITHMNLLEMRNIPLRSTFPRLIFNLRNLRYLRIEARYSIFKTPGELSEVISHLPGSLEKLKIVDVFALVATLDWSQTPCHDEQIDDFLLQPYRSSAPPLDLKRILPQLQSLKLRSNMSLSGLPLHANAYLPLTLTQLGVRVMIQTKDEWSSLKLLPKTLREMKLEMAELPDLEWPSTELPNVQRISIHSLEPESSIKWLPPTLTELNCKVDWSFRNAQVWPSSTRFLAIEHVDLDSFHSNGSDWCSMLPKSLEKLHLTRNCKLELSLPDLLAKLPLGIKSVQLAGPSISPSIGNPPSFLNLKELHLHYIAVAQLTSLPQTLETLHFSIEEPTATTIVLNQLPPKLTSLILYMSIDATDDMIKLQGHFPSGLTLLDLSSSQLDETTIPEFPTSITTLSFYLRNLLPLHEHALLLQSKLPPNLTRFNADSWHCDALESLPSSLQSLRFRDLFGCYNSPKTLEGGLFDKLPVGIASFSCRCPHPDGPRNQAMLPAQRMLHMRNLRIINFYGRYASAWLRQLPQSLQNIYIGLAELNEEDIPFIPPNVTYLDFGDSISYNSALLCSTWPLSAEPVAVRNRGAVQKAFRARRLEHLSRY